MNLVICNDSIVNNKEFIPWARWLWMTISRRRHAMSSPSRVCNTSMNQKLLVQAHMHCINLWKEGFLLLGVESLDHNLTVSEF